MAQQDMGRMQSVDIVRAMAIALVVFGHALIHAKCGFFLMECIYSFHMPLLFLLSGFVAAASWERSVADDPRLALRKIGRSARRLLVPYAICGIAVVPIVNFMQTGCLAASFVSCWRNAFLLNRFLWYLPCCFFLICIFALVALSMRRTDGVRWLIGVGVAFMAVVAVNLLAPGVDYARSVMNYFAAFFAGAWLWPLRGRVLSPGRWLLAVSSAAFVVLAVLFASISSPSIAVKGVIKPLAGVAALFPLLAVAKRAKGLAASLAAHVGRTTLFIYCFDHLATPMAVRYFRPAGVLPTIAVAAGVVAAGVLLNLAWEYAILTVLKRQFGSGRTTGG